MKKPESKLKKVVKVSTLFIVICCISISCQKKADKEVIESLTEENTKLEHIRLEMEIYKKDLLENIDVQYALMTKLINPKKVKSFEKDVNLKSELKSTREEIEKITGQFADNINNLAKSNKSNTSFIELTKSSEKSEKEIKTEWRQNVSVSEGIIEKNKVLQLKLNDLSERNKKLIDKVIEKYGGPAK